MSQEELLSTEQPVETVRAYQRAGRFPVRSYQRRNPLFSEFEAGREAEIAETKPPAQPQASVPMPEIRAMPSVLSYLALGAAVGGGLVGFVLMVRPTIYVEILKKLGLYGALESLVLSEPTTQQQLSNAVARAAEQQSSGRIFSAN